MSSTISTPDNASLQLSSPLSSMTEHLSELRGRLIWSVVSWLTFSSLCFYYAEPLITYLKWLVPEQTLFIQLTPGEAFVASFKFSMFCGLGLALPIMLYHGLRFIGPGLKPKEKRVLFPLSLLGLCLFCGGVLFGYWVILPLMLRFLLYYGTQLAANQLSIGAYLDFCTAFLFASGLVFQLPLVLLLASLLGLTTSNQLISQWKVVIVIALILAAVITPSADPFSQITMGCALYGLYGFSILLIKLARR